MENLTALQSAMRELEKIDSSFFNANTSKGIDFLQKMNIFLEMEKQQIIDAYQNGGIDGQVFALTRKTNIENGEQYYNQTFKN
jgi:hypothetical protein